MSAPPRIRRDPRDAAPRARAAPPIAAASAIIRVENPACSILAVVDATAGRLSRADREMMAAARRLADALHGEVVMLAGHGSDVEPGFRPEQEGADAVMLPVHTCFADDLAELRVPFAIAAAAACAARHILFPETAMGGELGRRVAARLGERPATRVLRLTATEVLCAADAGRTDVTRPPPRVVIVAPEAFAPLPPGPPREARRLEIAGIAELTGTQPTGVRIVARVPPDPASIALTEAELIISAGGGMTDWGAFHEVARLLGAAEAGSRVVCDAGSLPRARQVGVSGVLVSPACYLAFGIAGASQHLQGIEGAGRVVAVNRDRHAAILKRADLAIVGDVQAVLLALVARARARDAAHVP